MYENSNEDWKYIPGCGTTFMLSSLGRVYNAEKEIYLSPDRYNNISIVYEGFRKTWSIHTLMGCLFLGNDINDPYRNRILFKDGNNNNLSLDNLYIEDTSDLLGEEWRSIGTAAGRPVQDFYQVSNLGRVKSIKHIAKWNNYGKLSTKAVPEMILSQIQNENNYLTVWLSALTKPDITAQVHRLVAAAFCENDDPEHKVQVNHIDGDPSNNCASNLEWCTPSENSRHAIETGLKGDWNGRKLRYPVLHLESGKLYKSMSDVDKALGRSSGYCQDHLRLGKPVTDIEGNLWTLEVYKDVKHKVCTEGQHCVIEEFPNKEFISLGQASAAIGRYEGYISEALKRGGVIRNKAGQIMHVHLIGDAPVVSANDAYQKKKAEGLIPEKKQRKVSEWSPRKSLKHVETGDIYSSMAEACRAMGRKDGYLGDCFAFNRDCIDANGVKWTFEFLDEMVKINYKKNPCFFDEYPDKEFDGMGQASQFIGKEASYISGRVSDGKPILDSFGMELHFHFKDAVKEENRRARYSLAFA